MWRPPPAALPLVLAMGLATMTPHLGQAFSFPQDQEPISRVSRESSRLYAGFQGLQFDNDTLRLGLDFQKMLRINHMLYIAARDHVFAINLTSILSRQIVTQQHLTWKTQDLEKKCRVRGKNTDECYNYIKVLVPRDDETLFACGTNAFNPMCRNYKVWSLEQDGEDVVGQARCPFDSHQSNVGLFAEGNFYSATMTDFLASDAVIYRSLGETRPVLRTVKYDSKWLREPRFLHTIDYGNYVYFFFSEIAVESTNMGKMIFSRVARVCKNDNGGSPRVLERYWTSFLKARLNCSIPGDSLFYFDVLQSLTDVLQLNHKPAVIGVFTTQVNSISGSAVCAFYMDDIEATFSNSYKEQRSSESIWTPIAEDQVPKPRPGCCAGEGSAADYKSSTSFPDSTLTFIKSHPLMDSSVQAVDHRPIFTRTASRYKLTQIMADTSAGPFKNSTVVFLGSEDGHILKILVNSEGAKGSFISRLLEDIDVYDPERCLVRREDRRVLSLELDRDHHAVFVAFTSCVIRVPLSHCSNFNTCKRHCLSSKDPYCVWTSSRSCCSVSPGFSGEFEQNLTDNDDLDSFQDTPGRVCTHSTGHDSAYGVRRPPELSTDHSVHYTLLIACVVVAFVLGAFLSGFLVSCFCTQTGHKSKKPVKDPEVQIPQALSLHSLAKLNGLLEGSLKDDMLKMSSTNVPNFVSSRDERPLKRDCDFRDALPPHTQWSQLSGLPTPDLTPELPIKSMKVVEDRWEKNHNCSDTKELKFPLSGFTPSLDMLCSVPDQVGGVQVKVDDRVSSSRQYPGLSQKVMEVTSLDELLKHVTTHKSFHMMSPPGLTDVGGLNTFNRHFQAQIPDTESAPYYSSSTLPKDSLTRRMDVLPDIPPHHISTLERKTCSQRHSGFRHPASIQGQDSFCQNDFDQPSLLLSHMNLTGSSQESRCFLHSGYVKRQVSYSRVQHEKPERRLRRTSSLKPTVTLKPLYIPAMTPLDHQREFNY